MNKQIEEMRKDIYGCNPTECYFGDQCEKCPRTEITKELYNAGYRKASEVEKELADWKAIAEQYQKQFEDCYEEKAKIASEVAREIFAEIEQALLNLEYKTTYRHTHVPLETMVEVGNWILHEAVPQRLAEIKKKYEVTEDVIVVGLERAYDDGYADGKKEVATKILDAIKKKARTGYLLSDPPKIMLEILEQDLIKIIQEVQEDDEMPL